MKVTIEGIRNDSYVDKKTGELKERMIFSFSVPFKNVEGATGKDVGIETFTPRDFPEQFAEFRDNPKKYIGKTAILSKNVRTVGDKSWAYLEELEVLV